METIDLRIEKINEKAVVPTKGTEFSAGLDLTAVDYKVKDEGRNGIVLFDTGLKIEIPTGYFGGIYLRSGIASKGIWSLANGVGIIDSDYRGPLMILCRYVSGARFFKFLDFREEIQNMIGQRIAQLIIQPHPNVILKSTKNLTSTERGEGGFGSTDK